MKNKPKRSNCMPYINNSYEAKPLERILEKVREGNMTIEDEKPIIYTDKKDGVLPGYNIRTDRFEIMREAAEKISQAEASKIGKSENKPEKEQKEETKTEEKKPEAGPSGTEPS